MDLEPGLRIDKYEVLELLGSGAMASVFKVRHTQLDAIYALKLLDRASRRTRDRLLLEGRVQAGLRHPNIVAVSDVVEHDGQPGLVMEYVPGLDMAAYIARHHPIDLATIDRLAIATIKGVRAAHRAGQIHRDLKPANILIAQVDDDVVPKIADFGLVKALGDESSEGMSRTRTGAILGSPAFMSPEQTRSSKHVDDRADLWALGTVLYQLITGELAFPAEDLVMLFSKVRCADYVPIEELRGGVPDRMRLAVEAALMVEPEARVQSCDELLAIWTGNALPRNNTSSTETISGSFLTPMLDDNTPPSAPPERRPELTPARLPSDVMGTLVPASGSGSSSNVDTLITHSQPERSSSALWLLPWVLAALGGVGMLSIGGVAVGLWLGQGSQGGASTVVPPPEDLVPNEPSPEPNDAPKVEEPTTIGTPSESSVTMTTDPVRPPQPEPSSGDPSVPPSTRAPGKTPAAASTTPPEPVTPASETVQVGTFSVTGGAEEAWLVRQGTYHPPGEVPPGTYTVAARFPGHPVQPVSGLVVEVVADENVFLDCVAPFRTCRQK